MTVKQRKHQTLSLLPFSRNHSTFLHQQHTATLAKYKAQAEGIEELLSKQAEGFKKLVDAAGGDSQSAIAYLMLDKLTDIARIQVDAIKDLNIDKVVVYDNGSGEGMCNFAFNSQK